MNEEKDWRKVPGKGGYRLGESGQKSTEMLVGMLPLLEDTVARATDDTPDVVNILRWLWAAYERAEEYMNENSGDNGNERDPGAALTGNITSNYYLQVFNYVQHVFNVPDEALKGEEK